YAMLGEGKRRAEAGQRVVLGWIEQHGRSATRDRARALDLVPPRLVEYRGSTFNELDIDAIVARDPEVVLVDELAHTNVDHKRHRTDDVAELLERGITVFTTLNIGNLVSVREYVAQITGAGTVECVPDEFVRDGEIELVDPPPELLRQRIAAGEV